MCDYYLQAGKYIKSVDERTTEVSDFSMLVRGLPENANVHEVRHVMKLACTSTCQLTAEGQLLFIALFAALCQFSR